MQLSSRKNYKRSYGKKAGVLNRLAFKELIENCEKNDSWQAIVSTDGSRLVKSRIAGECGFDKSCFGSNEKLANMLRRTEAILRLKGVLSGKIDDNNTNNSRDEKIADLEGRADQLLEELSRLREWLNDVDNDLFLIGRP